MFAAARFQILPSRTKAIGALAALIICAESASAQTNRAGFPASLKDGLKTYLTADNSAYLRVNFVAQVRARARYNEISGPDT